MSVNNQTLAVTLQRMLQVGASIAPLQAAWGPCQAQQGSMPV
jgi:hypothetical protein